MSPDVIFISSNTRELTLGGSAVGVRLIYIKIQIIIVDNQSTDGSADDIATEFPQLTLIRSAREPIQGVHQI